MVTYGIGVKAAFFLNSSNNFLVLFENTNLIYLVDLTTNIQYPLNPLSSTDQTVDYANNIYTCFNNVITKTTISSFDPNALSVTPTPFPSSPFILPLNMSEDQ